MALYPNARHRLIAAGANDPPIIVIGAILHVDAGNSKSLYGYFSSGASNGIESHFHVPKEGQIEQYRDTGREADANLKANSFIGKDGRRYGYVSIETQGYGAGEWNAHQLAEIKALLIWLSKTHNFPLRRCPAHTESGVGYHVMFGAPGPWTPVSKSCPGPDRIKQFNNILVPWFATADSEDIMAISDADAAKIASFVWAKIIGPAGNQSSAADCAVKSRFAAEKWGEGGEHTATLARIETNTDNIPKA